MFEVPFYLGQAGTECDSLLEGLLRRDKRGESGEKKLGIWQEKKKCFSTGSPGLLTTLWRSAGQCREGQVHDVTADDRGL